MNHPTKRHCMIVHAHYPLGETRVQRQAEALLDAGIEVDVICLRHPEYETPQEVVNGATVYRVPAARERGDVGFGRQLLEYLRFFWLTMLTLMRLHRQKRYDVVQVHNLPDFLIFSAWYPKLTGAKLILDLHDLMPEFFASRADKDLSHWLVRLVTLQEKISCRFAHRVITVTELWRQTLIGRGIPAEKVHVVMNVADDRMFYRTNNNHNGKPNGFHVFYHGAIVPRYGIDLIIKAVAQAREKIPDVCLTLHGDSGYRQTLEALAKELGVQNSVNFSYKFLPMAKLPDLIRTADLAIVPYRRDIFTDGILPTKLMEYTALGVPVITVHTPAIDTYFDETMVEFFESENVDDLVQHLVALHQNQSRLKSLVENSDKFNQDYNWSKQKAGYVALVRSLHG
ncbi:MAG: glycosyltransferase family 4 protein [Chloroflexota bacterium]|nr:glycosyltransferase family 4 protein [Chloroflexota bacterium]